MVVVDVVVVVGVVVVVDVVVDEVVDELVAGGRGSVVLVVACVVGVATVVEELVAGGSVPGGRGAAVGWGAGTVVVEGRQYCHHGTRCWVVGGAVDAGAAVVEVAAVDGGAAGAVEALGFGARLVACPVTSTTTSAVAEL